MPGSNFERNAIDGNMAVRVLVGRSATVVVKDGKYRGKSGKVIGGRGPGAGEAAAQVCVRVATKSVMLPLTAVRETVVSRFVHQLTHLIPAPRR